MVKYLILFLSFLPVCSSFSYNYRNNFKKAEREYDSTIDSLNYFRNNGAASVDYSKLYMPNTLNESRNKFRTDLIINTILGGLKKPLNDVNEVYWQNAMDGMELALFKNDLTYKSLKKAFSELSKRSLKFQRQMLETVYCLYPNEFTKEIEEFVKSTTSPKLFAMGINYLMRINSRRNRSYSALMNKKFSGWKTDPILILLEKRLSAEKSEHPPLVDILSNTFEKGTITLFSFQRKNRDYPGITVVRRSNGKFARTTDGNIFHISELARSISNLPCYLTNGNTPQGLFSIQGIDISKNEFLGITPNIQTVLPFEVSIEKYFHNTVQKDADWLTGYKNLLPESWREYSPVYEAYFAGQAGRSEIIMHGTTVDPEFYTGKPYYPNSPTFGCLSAKEIWDGQSGKCLISDQAQLINSADLLNNKPGYLIVIELDEKNQPVTLDEILIDLLKAEKQ